MIKKKKKEKLFFKELLTEKEFKLNYFFQLK